MIFIDQREVDRLYKYISYLEDITKAAWDYRLNYLGTGSSQRFGELSIALDRLEVAEVALDRTN